MHKYKNKSDSLLTLVGFGQVQAGQEFTTKDYIENPNIEYLGEIKDANNVVGTTGMQPNAVTEATHVNSNPDANDNPNTTEGN